MWLALGGCPNSAAAITVRPVASDVSAMDSHAGHARAGAGVGTAVLASVAAVLAGVLASGGAPGGCCRSRR
jgi:hypothetical protein